MAISEKTKTTKQENETESTTETMEYAWMEPKHDPIATDTNLAEIDFENFRNEDLAYAYSCGVSATPTRFLKCVFRS